MSGELCFMTATELAARIRARQVSVVEVVRAHLAQIERVNPKVNAIVTLTAERALAWGVANQLAPKAEVIDNAHALADKIASRAPIAIQMAKQAIDAGDAYHAMEQVSSAATAFTEDAVEGFASFSEKREPHYRGT